MFVKILFWLLMILWLIGGWLWWKPAAAGPGPYANNLFLWVLLAILGYFAIGLPQ